MKNSREIIGLPVIELSEGKALGRVSGLVVDPASGRIEAFQVGEKSLLKNKMQLVPFSKVKSIGQDAITLNGQEAVFEQEQTPELVMLLDKKLLGGRLVTADGTLIGTVEDFSFNTDTGALGNLFASSEKAHSRLKIEIAAVQNFGRDFIILAENFRELTEEIEPAEKRSKQFAQTLEAKAIDFAINREVGQDVLDVQGNIIISKGEKVTSQIIELARSKKRLNHLLIASGVGELLEGLDFTREKLDIGSRRLLDAWNSLRNRSQEWMSRKLDDDHVGPTGELRELWIHLQDMISQGSRDLEETTISKIKEYVHGKMLAYPVYHEQGNLLASKGDLVTESLITRAEASGRLPQLFLSATAGEVQSVLDPIKMQIKDVLHDWGKKQ